MDKFKDYINAILKGVCISKTRRRELEEEIRGHLEMLKEELIKDGYSEDEAQLKAIHKFGEVKDIRRKFRRVFTPYLRFKDMLTKKRLIIKESLQWAALILSALVISLSIRSYAFAATEVRQCSMQDTLYEEHRLIESKIEYYYSEPKRGDIVIINQEPKKGVFKTFIENTKELIEAFYKNEENETKRLIKRVIGVPGDEIDIRDGKVYINGQIYYEPYVKGNTYARNMKFPIKVPEKKYFVMGDI